MARVASRPMPGSSGEPSSLRARTARGGALNAAFLSGAEALLLVQGLLATALLGPSAIGLYGVVTTTAMTIVALRRVGIDEAFVAHAGDDEETEFQRAFGVELAIGLVGSLLIALLAPLLAAIYDDDRLLALTLGGRLPAGRVRAAGAAVGVLPPHGVPAAAAAAGRSSRSAPCSSPSRCCSRTSASGRSSSARFCAHVAAIVAAAVVSPYRLRPRFEREAARRYLRFSWPVFVTALAALAVAQGQVAVFGLSEDGLAAAGWITLAATLTRYADRADQIVATTIYPAIVRVRDRVDVLEELFAKTNRLTLMWAFPFGAGLVLFGPDLIGFVLGDEWEPAIVLLGGMAAATALQQVGYNWFAFFRARGESRPQAVESVAFVASFAAFAVPGALVWGSWGFVVGRIACTGCVLAVRRIYVHRLLPGVRLFEIARRAAVPVLAASAPVVALRLALWGGERPLWQAVGELALWLGGLALATRRFESGLLRELWSYLRPGGRLVEV